MSDERFDAETISAGLRTQWLGHPLHCYPVIPSTNDEARRMAVNGAPHGTVVIADTQTAGRGRMHRRWIAPAGSALLLSLIMRPTLPVSRVSVLTMLCGLSAADAIEQIAGVRAGLKWPNDLLLGDRKLAGILTEMASTGDVVDFVIVGIGINVNARPQLQPTAEHDAALTQDTSLRELPHLATCVAAEAGKAISRLTLLWRFLDLVERRYADLVAGVSPHAEWSRRLSMLDRHVRVETLRETIEGRVMGVDMDGALIVELADATRRRVLAGDITLRNSR